MISKHSFCLRVVYVCIANCLCALLIFIAHPACWCHTLCFLPSYHSHSTIYTNMEQETTDSVQLTASAEDGILDVTPVHSYSDSEAAADQEHNNEDAFSSSTEATSTDLGSEWDKALLSGRETRANLYPSFSEDGSEFLSQAEQQVLQEAASLVQEPMLVTNSNLTPTTTHPPPPPPPLSSGVLPDILMTMRQNIESLTLFDSDMMKLMDPDHRASLKRSSQQALSAAVLVSLAHKRYERRRLAAMEIEKVVRALVHQHELERVQAILLLLSDDYVRSTNEDARKGGVVALAAAAIGLKKVSNNSSSDDCRDLILASVVHACQDHSQRVRYYATESLFNVIKVMPALAIQHFFILYEILRSLYADVDVDVRSGAALLDQKLKEVIVSAMNAGSFTADQCVPVLGRFVHVRHKATNKLTLSWLQELNEKVVGAPILEFLHLFLGGILHMIADPSLSTSALAFLQSVLPKLLHDPESAVEDVELHIDFDKILQSLVTTMEHPDPFVRKVAMYWMSRIVKAHIGDDAEASVRNSLPHVLPGIMLSIGDRNSAGTKDSFLPDQSTQSLAEQTNACLQEAVQRGGVLYVPHLEGFIVALREELDEGLSTRNPPAVERSAYRADVKSDGTGIESAGWYRSSEDTKRMDEEAMVMSKLCALQWVAVLYESVVPDSLKADVGA